MPRKDPGPSVKDKKLYEKLRDEGNSKQKAARIANAGVLIARHGLTPDTAFTRLRRYSQNTNTQIGLIARQLINTGRLTGLKREINAIRNNK